VSGFASRAQRRHRDFFPFLRLSAVGVKGAATPTPRCRR
jgi:hypothetical protein